MAINKLSYKDFKKLQKAGGFNKYHAKRTSVNGINFPSKLEAETYEHLLFLQKLGEVMEIKLQQVVYLTAAKIAYKADFKVVGKNETYWVEAKGLEHDSWSLRKKLWKHYGPGRLEVWKKRGPGGVFLAETIIPRGSVCVCESEQGRE